MRRRVFFLFSVFPPTPPAIIQFPFSPGQTPFPRFFFFPRLRAKLRTLFPLLVYWEKTQAFSCWVCIGSSPFFSGTGPFFPIPSKPRRRCKPLLTRRRNRLTLPFLPPPPVNSCCPRPFFSCPFSITTGSGHLFFLYLPPYPFSFLLPTNVWKISGSFFFFLSHPAARGSFFFPRAARDLSSLFFFPPKGQLSFFFVLGKLRNPPLWFLNAGFFSPPCLPFFFPPPEFLNGLFFLSP